MSATEFSTTPDKLLEAARKLWPAYIDYSSSGCSHGAFERHVWPVIKEVRTALLEMEVPQPLPWEHPREGYSAGFHNEDGTFGMYAGVCSTIEEIEQFEPYLEHGRSHPRCFIIYFDGQGGEHVVAEWLKTKWAPSDGT